MCLLLLNNSIWCTYAITVPIGLFTLYFHLFILSPSLAGNSSHDSSGKTLAWKEGLILFFISSSLIIFLFADFFFHFLRHQFNKVSAEVSSAANRCRKFLLHKVAIAYIATSLDLSYFGWGSSIEVTLSNNCLVKIGLMTGASIFLNLIYEFFQGFFIIISCIYKVYRGLI